MLTKAFPRIKKQQLVRLHLCSKQKNVVRKHQGLFEEHPDTLGGQEAADFDGAGGGGGAESAAGRAEGQEGPQPDHLHRRERQGQDEQGAKVQEAEEEAEEVEGRRQKGAGEGGGAEAEQEEAGCEEGDEEGKVETVRAKEDGQAGGERRLRE